MYTTVISAAQLDALQRSGQPVMLFDCSFELAQPEAGDLQYQQQHIAGAVRADLDRHLSAAKGASDAASDQWSLCVAWWEALTGARPFVGRTYRDLVAAITAGVLWRVLGASREAPRAASSGALRWGFMADGDDQVYGLLSSPF